MRNWTVLLLVLALSVLFASGCETIPPPPPMGDSVRLAMEMQKLDPTPVGAEPVEGLDGEKAFNAQNIYRNKNSEGLPDKGTTDSGSVSGLKIE